MAKLRFLLCTVLILAMAACERGGGGGGGGGGRGGRGGRGARGAAPGNVDQTPAAASASGAPDSISRPSEPPQYWAARLRSGDMMVRRQALSSLGMYGRDAAPFVDAIVRQVGDPDEKTGFTAAWALAQVGLPAQPAMQELLKSSEAVIRQRGAYALGEARVADAAPALERLAATDPSNDVREMALWASENMSQRGPVAGNVIFLAEGTDSPDPSVRLEAYQRLGIMAPGNRFVIPILVRGISDSVPAVRNAAVEGLANAGPLGASALTAVLVTDRDRSARWASILGLSRRRTGF